MALNRFYVISPLALVAVSACRSPYQANTAVNGNIVKGPLSNALVFLDLDGDNILDANEQSVRTDANGKFTINTTASSYKIVALTDDSTVDTSSGSVLAGVTLTAPQGASVVTPTTTLMEEGGLTAKQVAEVLDLPDGVDPLTFNPFAAGVDATKALAAGASSIMVGSIFGGTDETPGTTITKNNKRFKIYRGMASLAAAQGRKTKETGQIDFGDDLNDFVAEGVEAFVPYKGSVTDILVQITGGIRSGLSYCGGHNIKQMQENAEFIKMSRAGFAESNPHDVDVM